MLSVAPQFVGKSSRMLRRWEFAAVAGQEGSMFLWLGIKQTTAFLFSPPNDLPKQKAAVMRKKVQFFQSLPLSEPHHTARFLTVHFHNAGSDFLPGRQGLLLWGCKKHLLSPQREWPQQDATSAERKAYRIPRTCPLPDPEGFPTLCALNPEPSCTELWADTEFSSRQVCLPQTSISSDSLEVRFPV